VFGCSDQNLSRLNTDLYTKLDVRFESNESLKPSSFLRNIAFHAFHIGKNWLRKSSSISCCCCLINWSLVVAIISAKWVFVNLSGAIPDLIKSQDTLLCRLYPNKENGQKDFLYSHTYLFTYRYNLAGIQKLFVRLRFCVWNRQSILLELWCLWQFTVDCVGCFVFVTDVW